MTNDTIEPIGDRILAVGLRQWPAAILIESIDHVDILGEGSEHRWYHRRQARVMFESGWGVSVVWGSGTYSPNHHRWGEHIIEAPTTVECGVIDKIGLLGGRVAGHVDADTLNDLLTEVSRWPTGGAMSLPAHLEEMFE